MTVPADLPPPGFASSATETVPVKVVAGLPNPSCAVTCTAGVIPTPAVTLEGWTVKASRVATPAVMSKGALGTPVRPAALAASV